MSFDFSRLFETCTIAAAWVKPGSQVTDTPEIYKTQNPTQPFEFMNGIFRTQFSEKNLEAKIQEQFDSYFSQNLPFRWNVYQHSTPKDLYSYLSKRNASTAFRIDGLYCPVDELELAMPEGITVEPVSSANIEDYIGTIAESWSLAGDGYQAMARGVREDFARGMNYFPFLARYKGEPASTGFFRVVGDHGYMLGGATRPNLRGKGSYTGLVRHRVRVMKEMKLKLCLIGAKSDSSSPICQKIGFRLGTDYNLFIFSK
jgi:hypothetical protein